jgi:biopolymer transport protein ExbD
VGPKIKLCMIVLLVVTANAYSDDSFEKAANQYCGFYSPEFPSSLGPGAELQQIFGHILEQQKTINNKKLQDILKTADKADFSAYYASIKANIEKELGRPWSCADFDQFFLPKQKVVSLSLKGVHHKSIDPLADNVITIMVAHSGEILVNGAALKEPSKLKAALESRIAKRSAEEVSFVLYFDEDSNGGLVSDVLGVLTDLGVDSVDLIGL